MLVEGLQGYLAADSGLQAQLGTPSTRGDGTTGIFPSMAKEQTTMPYIVLMQVSGEPFEINFQGTGRLQNTRWRFSCYGTTYKNAKALAKVLKRALFSLDGTLPGTTTKAEVHGCWLRLEADDFEAIPRGTIFSTHVDFEINYADYDDA